MATTVFFHFLGLFGISALVVRITSLTRENLAIIFLSVIFILFGGQYYYYISKKNGARIIKQCSGIWGDRVSVIIGGLIAAETFIFFPILCLILAVFLHR